MNPVPATVWYEVPRETVFRILSVLDVSYGPCNSEAFSSYRFYHPRVPTVQSSSAFTFPVTRHPKRLRAITLSVVFIGVCIANASAQNPWVRREMRDLAEACDARDPNAVLSFIGRDVALDAAVLRALASVQSDTALPLLLSKLDSQLPQERKLAATALGQTLRNSPRAVHYDSLVFDRFRKEREGFVAAALLDAIGRSASASTLERVAELRFTDATISAAQAMCIGRFAVRSIRSAQGTQRAAVLASEQVGTAAESAVRRQALYALSRIGDSTLLAPYVQVVRDAAQSSDPEVRMYAASLTGKIHTLDMDTLAFSMTEDTDWRVRVNAIRAAGAAVPNPGVRRQALRVLVRCLRGREYQTVKATLQTIAQLPVADQPVMMALKKMLDTTRSPDLREDAMRALASVFPDFALLVFRGWRTSAVPPVGVLQALGLAVSKQHRRDPFVEAWLREFISSSDPRRSTAAIESWVASWKLLHPLSHSAKDSAVDQGFRNGILAALRVHSTPPGNAAAVQVIAEALSDSLFASREYSAPLAASLKQFSPSKDVETVVSLLEALGKLADSSAVQSLQEYTADENSPVRTAAVKALQRSGIDIASSSSVPRRFAHDWALLTSFRRNPTALVRTTRGTFRFELSYQEAPFTVESFIALARKHFYDGLLFHRVVPNFVVQGGDPRGDGTGGPPYTIRSEFGERSFRRGDVGIASSGKDTEGSQFFIMHSPAPHLDGRYTLFGTVTEGMDVVDRLEIGDRMLDIQIDL